MATVDAHVIVTYQQSLEDVLLFLMFGVVAKAVIFFMFRPPVPKVPLPRVILWYGLGAWWLASGILAMWPTVAVTPASALHADPLLRLGLPWWQQHPLGHSLWSMVIQVVFGIMLLAQRENLAGRITLAVSLPYALLLWIGDSWGGLATPAPTLAGGAPGAPLLAMGAAIWLLLPVRIWSSADAGRMAQVLLAGLWLLAAVWHVVPVVDFWTSPAWAAVWAERISSVQPAAPLAFGHWLAAWSELHPLAMNVVMTLIDAAVGVVLLTRRWTPPVIGGVAAILLLMWWAGQGLGFVAVFGGNANTAPLLAVALVAVSRMRLEAPVGLRREHTVA